MSAKSSWNASFEKRLQRYLSFPVQLVINENRSTVLSIRGRRLSVHKMFLEAPDEVVRELARYAMGKRTKPILRHFIQSTTYEADEELLLDSKGRVYNLQEMMEEINDNYFEGRHNLTIGWFGRMQKKRRHITFGQYLKDSRAIKIHRLLDDPFFPRYFVAFVIYHEMLHAEIPGYHDERGYFRIHGPEFKRREKEFHAYARARRFEKANREKIFGWA